jgi:Flp pilus assembly pilin Flp
MKSTGKKGQALSEYLILTALVAIASIGVVQVLGSNIQSRLAMISNALRGDRTKLAGRKAEAKHFEVRDLGDFQEAMEDSSSGGKSGGASGGIVDDLLGN